jgi:hypothetical protein
MIFLLLISTFLTGFVVSFIVNLFFKKPISQILKKLIDDDIYTSWLKYMVFAIYVVGISSGVNLYNMEKFIEPSLKEQAVYQLNSVRWSFEIYRSVINTLTSLAWLLLVFFIIALIVFVIKKIFDGRGTK